MTASAAANGKRKMIGPDDAMPWGKHKGIPINQCPRDYLVWALRNMDACRPDHERYWPEYTQVLESLVGTHAPVTPPTMPLIPLCVELNRRKVTLEVRGHEIRTSQPIEPDLQSSIDANKTILAAVLRCSNGPQPVSGGARLIQGAELRMLAKAWYGQMSRRYHPDTGGSQAAQVAVNDCYQTLIEMIAAWEVKR